MNLKTLFPPKTLGSQLNKDINISEERLIEQFNKFLEFSHSEHKFDTLSYGHGFSGLFCYYVLYGKLDVLIDEYQSISTQQFNQPTYPIIKTFFKTMLNVTHLQAQAKLESLNLETTSLVTDIDVINVSDFLLAKDYSAFATISKQYRTLDHFFGLVKSQNSKGSVIRLQSRHDLSCFIQIEFDEVSSTFKAYFHHPHREYLGEHIYLRTLLSTCLSNDEYLDFKDKKDEPVLISLLSDNVFKLVREDKGYVFNENNLFNLEELLVNYIHDNRVFLLESECHVVAIYKLNNNSFVFYNTGEKEPIPANLNGILTLIKSNEDLHGHATLTVFRRVNQAPRPKNINCYTIKTFETVTSQAFYQDKSKFEAFIFHCVKHKHPDLLQWHIEELWRGGIDFNFDSFVATFVEERFYNVVEMLLKKDGTLISVGHEGGMTLLHIACEKGDYSMVDLLINKYHARTDILDNNNKTAFDLAKEKGHVSIIDDFFPEMREDDLEDSWESEINFQLC
jgi:hypothetical protein